MEVSPSEKNGAVLNPLLQTFRCLTAHSHIGLGNMGPITVISGQVRLSQSYYKQDGFSPENEPHKGLPEVIFPTIQEKMKVFIFFSDLRNTTKTSAVPVLLVDMSLLEKEITATIF